MIQNTNKFSNVLINTNISGNVLADFYFILNTTIQSQTREYYKAS